MIEPKKCKKTRILINIGFLVLIHKAGNETRTHDPFITSEVLYRLSYSSLCLTQKILYRILQKKQVIFFYFSFIFRELPRVKGQNEVLNRVSRNDPGHRNTLFAHKVSWTVDESRKLEYTGAAGYFVDMLLLFAIFLILHMRKLLLIFLQQAIAVSRLPVKISYANRPKR